MGAHEAPTDAFPDGVVRDALDVVLCALATFQAVSMSGAAILRVKKLKGGGIITVAARHNKREIQAEMGATGSIDPTRSCLNEILVGPSAAADVGKLAKDLMTAAGVVKLRKDAVMALEFVFSLPPGHALDDRAYFTACATWAGATLGGAQNVLSVDSHRDEAAPHCHVLLLPLINGRMDGSNLVGGKQKLMALQKDFYLKVAALYGLSKAPARLSGTAKQAAAMAVLQKLREASDSALQSAAWVVIREAVERDPAPFLMALGIELATLKKPGRTMAQIFTSKGKGWAKEPSNPIGFTPPEKEQTLCSVGFTPKPPLSAASPRPTPPASPPPARPPRPAPKAPAPERRCSADGGELETVRVRDSDLDPARFHDGDYRQEPPPAARRQRQAADAWVKSALAV